MNHAKAEGIAARLLANAAGLKYGTVTVCAKLHDGRIVEVIYTTAESTRTVENGKTVMRNGEIR
jgi:hypothetical protein